MNPTEQPRDRATYDPSLASDVNYTVASSIDAPLSLTFGPSFFSRAGSYEGVVTVGMYLPKISGRTYVDVGPGLNRELDNLANTIEAANVAQEKMPNLEAIELGNEPNRMSISVVRIRRHL